MAPRAMIASQRADIQPATDYAYPAVVTHECGVDSNCSLDSVPIQLRLECRAPDNSYQCVVACEATRRYRRG
jgi:hypothetical protein